MPYSMIQGTQLRDVLRIGMALMLVVAATLPLEGTSERIVRTIITEELTSTPILVVHTDGIHSDDSEIPIAGQSQVSLLPLGRTEQ
jgi:hypothetical protein